MHVQAPIKNRPKLRANQAEPAAGVRWCSPGGSGSGNPLRIIDAPWPQSLTDHSVLHPQTNLQVVRAKPGRCRRSAGRDHISGATTTIQYNGSGDGHLFLCPVPALTKRLTRATYQTPRKTPGSSHITVLRAAVDHVSFEMSYRLLHFDTVYSTQS